MKTKQKKWLKTRHKVVTNIGRVLLYPITCLKYGVKIDAFKQQGDRQYLILLNHQTPFDQFFVAHAFRGAIYYLATEDIFSNGWVSSLIRFLVAPIPIRKQTSDLQAVMNCARVAKEGGTIAIAPEGNRTYSGRTEYISPSIVKLAKVLKLPIAIFRIEGGYGVEPRWSNVVRKGKMRAYVSEVIEPEEYRRLSDEDFYEKIKNALYVDEAVADGTFRHKKCAEYLERMVYICPECGLAEFESHDDIVMCKKCGRKVQYLPTKEFKGVGFEFPFRFAADWYEYQKTYINELDVNQYVEKPLFEDQADVSEVIINKNKVPLRTNVKISLYGNRVVIDDGSDDAIELHFDEVTAASVLGRNKLNLYHDKRVYQFKGDVRFNSLKYVHIYYRYKNMSKGDKDGKFLGL